MQFTWQAIARISKGGVLIGGKVGLKPKEGGGGSHLR